MVVVKNGSDSSAPFLVPKDALNPSVLTFDTIGHAVATHLDGSLLGPTSLYPGLSTPGKGGETVTFWTVGFGLPTTLFGGRVRHPERLVAQHACLHARRGIGPGGGRPSGQPRIIHPQRHDPRQRGEWRQFLLLHVQQQYAVLPGVLVAVQ